MSAADGSLQAQVELVLGSLLKAATSELIRLFEGRCGASLRAPDLFPAEPRACRQADDAIRGPSSSSSGRSIGVQVDLDLRSPPEVLGEKVSSQYRLTAVAPAGVCFSCI